jgi:hypothetical protein
MKNKNRLNFDYTDLGIALMICTTPFSHIHSWVEKIIGLWKRDGEEGKRCSLLLATIAKTLRTLREINYLDKSWKFLAMFAKVRKEVQRDHSLSPLGEFFILNEFTHLRHCAPSRLGEGLFNSTIYSSQGRHGALRRIQFNNATNCLSVFQKYDSRM